MKKLLLVLLASFFFYGCASVPEFHTYSQGISDWVYDVDIVVSKFEGKYNTKEDAVYYSRTHAYEVCYDHGFKYVQLQPPIFSKKLNVNVWGGPDWYDYVVETMFSCTNHDYMYEYGKAVKTYPGKESATLLRTASNEEEKRRENLKMQNTAIGVVSAVLFLVTIIVIPLSLSD